MIAIDAGDLNEISDRGAIEGLSAAELSGARRPDDSCWTCSVAASDALRGKTTYGRSCSLGRVMPCSIVAEQRHKIIRKGVALVCEESVSGVRNCHESKADAKPRSFGATGRLPVCPHTRVRLFF